MPRAAGHPMLSLGPFRRHSLSALTLLAISSSVAARTCPELGELAPSNASGIYYAMTAQGRRVPVLDYSHPIFQRRAPSPLKTTTSLFMLRGLSLLPPAARRWIGRHSEILGNFLGGGQNKYLSGPATYLAKLGPKFQRANLFDRLAASSIQATEAARRGQMLAEMEASAMSRILETHKSVTVLNVGGGPASDTLNAMIALHDPLARRQARVHVVVLDSEADGAALGNSSLEALKAPGGRLENVDAQFTHVVYDWNAADPPDTVTQTGGPFIVSAEGSLFEYGSDEAILRNLEMLRDRTPADTLVVGSAFLADSDHPSPIVRAMMAISPGMGWKLRGMNGGAGLAGIEELAEKAGWEVTRTEKNSIYVAFTLRRRGPASSTVRTLRH